MTVSALTDANISADNSMIHSNGSSAPSSPTSPSRREHPWKLHTGAAGVRIGDGALGLKWQVAAPRVIGLVRIPVLRVSFRFAGVDEA